MTDASHTKSAAITEVMIQTMTRCIPLSIAELQNMSEEQVESILEMLVTSTLATIFNGEMEI